MNNIVDDLEDEKSRCYKERNKLEFFTDDLSMLPKENIHEIKELLDKSIVHLDKKIGSIENQIKTIQKNCKHDFADASDDRSNFTYYRCTKCNMYKGD